MMSKQNNSTEMFSLLEEWKTSGISAKKFCNDRSLSYHTFNYWLKKYRNKGEKKPQKGFIPLKIKEKESGICKCEMYPSEQVHIANSWNAI
jgi:transposase